MTIARRVGISGHNLEFIRSSRTKFDESTVPRATPVPESNARTRPCGRQLLITTTDPFGAEKRSELNRLTWQTASYLDSRLRNESLPILASVPVEPLVSHCRTPSVGYSGACGPN